MDCRYRCAGLLGNTGNLGLRFQLVDCKIINKLKMFTGCTTYGGRVVADPEEEAA